MKTLCKAFFVVVSLIVFSVLSVYAYLSVLDPGAFRDEIATVVKTTTGRDLVIKGDITFKGFPRPKLIVEGVSLSNAKWGQRSKLISADKVVAEVALIPLFSRTISIKRVVLLRPVLNLERNAKGESNWNLWEGAPPSGGSGALFFDISNVDVRNGRISYLNHAANRPSVLKVHNLKLRSKGFRQPLNVSFTGQFNKQPFRIRGQAGSLATLFKNDPLNVNLNVSSAGVVATLDGGVQRPMELRGLDAKLTLSARDLSSFFNAGRRPSGEPVVLSGWGRVRDKKNRYVVDNLELSIGKNDLSGSVSFGLSGGRSLIRGALGSKLMDLDSIFPESNKGGNARFFPDWTIPVETLRSVDTDINYSGRRVMLRGASFDRLNLNVGLRSGRLEIRPRGGLYGGKLDGKIHLNARSDTPSLVMEIRGTKVNMGDLLTALKNKQVMTGGRGQLYFKLEGSGRNLREIAASSNGRFLTSVGPGQFNNAGFKRIGADALMQLMRTFDPADKSDQFTSMQCGVILFDVRKGIAKTDRGIAAETKRMNVIGSGTIDLGSEKIDIALRAQPRDGVGLSASALGNMVRIGGTLSSPSASMDAVGALKTGASVGAAVATSGISLLVQGLFNRMTADSAPCKTALKVKRGQRQSSPKPSSKAASEQGFN